MADAKSVYDLLYRPPEQRPPPDEGDPDRGVRTEVGCWSHARRRFWEAAFTKDPLAREALLRIKRIFDADRALRDRRSDERTSLRDVRVRPYVEDFLAWSEAEYETIKDCRGPLRSAFGYVVRQADALRRFLENGRLPLTNTQSDAARGIRLGVVERHVAQRLPSPEAGAEGSVWTDFARGSRRTPAVERSPIRKTRTPMFR